VPQGLKVEGAALGSIIWRQSMCSSHKIDSPTTHQPCVRRPLPLQQGGEREGVRQPPLLPTPLLVTWMMMRSSLMTAMTREGRKHSLRSQQQQLPVQVSDAKRTHDSWVCVWSVHGSDPAHGCIP
jgi:hypothetical protein